MKIRIEASRSISVRLKQYEQIERDLNKLKFHLKTKKRVYEEQEYKNINQRLKECQFYFQRMKKEIIESQPNQIVDRNIENLSELKKRRIIQKERKTLDSNRHIIKKLNSNEEKFRIKLKSEQYQLSKSKLVLQYDLQPFKQLEKYDKKDKSAILNDNKIYEKSNNQRFVSEFQKNIKQKLGKISLDQYNDVQDFESIVQRSKQKIGKIYKVSKKPSLKLNVPLPNHTSRDNQEALNKNGSSVDVSQSHYLQSLRTRATRCRTDLSQRKKDEIDSVRHQKIDFSQKIQILNRYYQKYSNHQKSGDPYALQLMSKATLAKADLLLKKI